MADLFWQSPFRSSNDDIMEPVAVMAWRSAHTIDLHPNKICTPTRKMIYSWAFINRCKELSMDLAVGQRGSKQM